MTMSFWLDNDNVGIINIFWMLALDLKIIYMYNEYYDTQEGTLRSTSAQLEPARL